VADPGYEIVHAVLQRPLPYPQAFPFIERHLTTLGRPRTALCGVELRVGKQYTREQLLAPDGFNARYGAVLKEWGLLVNDMGCTTRVNIATELAPSVDQVLFAFSYTVPAPDAPPTFVTSGTPHARTLRPGETSLEALREKTADSFASVAQRVAGLGVGWEHATEVRVYCVYDLFPWLKAEVLDRIGPAALHGVVWSYGTPPSEGTDVEIDARGIRTELRLPASDRLQG
jgi:hypothetical protein